MKKYLVIDIGPVEILFIIFSEKGEKLNNSNSLILRRNIKEFCKQLDMIIKLHKDEIAGISISTIGIVDTDEEIIKKSKGIPFLNEINLKNYLEKKYKIPVHVENNAICAAMSEACKESDLNNDFIYIMFDSAFNGAIISKEKNKYKLIYSYEDDYRTLVHLSLNNLLVNICTEKNQILTREEIFDLLDSDDEKIRNIFKDWLKLVAKGILSLIYTYNPKEIIIGGIVGNFPIVIHNIEKAVNEIYFEFEGKYLKNFVKCKEIEKNESALGALINFQYRENSISKEN